MTSVKRVKRALDGNIDLSQLSREELTEFLEKAMQQKVRMRLTDIASVQLSGERREVFESVFAPNIHYEWEKRLSSAAERIFSAAESKGIKLALVKGFGVQKLYPKNVVRDFWDIDCVVPDFDSFLDLGEIIIQMGGTIKAVSLRKDGPDYIGVADFSFKLKNQLLDELTVECFIACQPLDKYSGRKLGFEFWNTLVRLKPESKIVIPSQVEALKILAGEIFENKEVLLRDYMDYLAIIRSLTRNNPLCIANEDEALIAWLFEQVLQFALDNALESPTCPHQFNGVLSAVPNVKTVNLYRHFFQSVKTIIRKSRSGWIEGFISQFVNLRKLWDVGYYVDAYHLPIPTACKMYDKISAQRGVLVTKIGTFILLPLGNLTEQDLTFAKQAWDENA